MIEEKTEMQLVEEQLAGCRDDLLFMRRYAGDSPIIDANIRHKAEQIKDLEERLAELKARAKG